MKHKYKVHHQVIFRNRVWFIDDIINDGLASYASLINEKGRGFMINLDRLKPIGYALIKPSAGGKFRYHTVSWNNEKLQTSQALDDKNHVKRMARKYFPSFHIVDKTV